MSNDYDVGYGKPPARTQFKPGQSGNPKGRGKGVRNLATDLALELAENIQVTEGGKQKLISKQRAIVKSLVARSLKGDPRAAGILLRAIPAVEQAQLAAAHHVTLSKADEEVLLAFRQQIAEEISSARKEKK
jgi:hypothetical protein